jgi:hypothetical protein
MKQTTQTKTINLQESEFFCNTCKQNIDLDRVIEFEQNHKNTYINPRLRKTKKIGLVFTRGSILFSWHEVHGEHHDWGNVAEAEEAILAMKKLQEDLDKENEFYKNTGAE